MQILPARFGRIAEIGKVGHPAQRQVLLKSCRVGCTGFNRSVEFEKFSKREGVNGKFHIAPAQHGRQFAGQQLGVGTGDVNVAVQLNAEGVNGFFPLRNFLNLVKKYKGLAFNKRSETHCREVGDYGASCQVTIKSLCRHRMFNKVHLDEMVIMCL